MQTAQQPGRQTSVRPSGGLGRPANIPRRGLLQDHANHVSSDTQQQDRLRRRKEGEGTTRAGRILKVIKLVRPQDRARDNLRLVSG